MSAPGEMQGPYPLQARPELETHTAAACQIKATHRQAVSMWASGLLRGSSHIHRLMFIYLDFKVGLQLVPSMPYAHL